GRLVHRRLEPGTIVLGRAADCDVTLADPAVSARHARVTVEGERVLLEDLASLNGCHMDDRRVFVAELRPGAILRLGGTEVHVLAEEDAGQAAARPARMVPTPGLAPALELLRLAAYSREPCVLTGETGCGKEVLARRLHELGPRRNGPFVAVNAAALPPELAESILFGHQRGSFTGATETHRGAFERANGGTLLLDELGEMRLELQAKLLRALEEGAVLPVGAERPIPVDVRVVAATNREPLAAVASGRLRLDLWHRLAVFVVRIPPLRARPQDIAPLAHAFLAAAGTAARGFTAAALRTLGRHRWPGNVRELRNVTVRAALASTGPLIDEQAVRNALDEPSRPPEVAPAEATCLLAAHHGNIAAAARAAGLPRTTFRDLLERERRRRLSARDEPMEAEPEPPDGWNRRLRTRIAG
ncbi:MAG: sigma 54-dependent Fis family transcriptional regulator, partial [Myxococcales bacterium]|nr:sigma 54-dependent Fis family transcriptional regulator [Myxococcales bacterium]